MDKPETGRHWFWRAFLTLVGLSLVAALTAIILPAYRAMRTARQINDQLSGMQEVLQALCLYDAMNGKLPDAVQTDSHGVELYSWRVSVLPFREGVGSILDLEASWKGATNRQLAERPDRIYSMSRSESTSNSVASHIAAVIGPRTAIRTSGSKKLADVPCDTILIAEVKHASHHWMSPGDLLSQEIDDEFVQGSDGEGIIIGFADGQVWFIDSSVPSDTLKVFTDGEDDSQRDREAMLGPYRRKVVRVENCDCKGESMPGVELQGK